MKLEKITKSIASLMLIFTLILWSIAGYLLIKWKFDNNSQFLKYAIVLFILMVIIGVGGLILLKSVSKIAKFEYKIQNDPKYHSINKFFNPAAGPSAQLSSREIVIILLSSTFLSVFAIIGILIFYSKNQQKMAMAMRWAIVGIILSFFVSFLWSFVITIAGIILNT